MTLRCPRCGTVVEPPATGRPVCPGCGFGGPAPPTGQGQTPGEASARRDDPAAQTGSYPQQEGFFPPHAGHPPQAGHDPLGRPVQETNGTAIASLVCGILAWVTSLVGFLFALLAIVLGASARSAIEREPHRWKGKAMATWGLGLGVAYFVVVILVAVIVFVLVQGLEGAP